MQKQGLMQHIHGKTQRLKCYFPASCHQHQAPSPSPCGWIHLFHEAEARGTSVFLSCSAPTTGKSHHRTGGRTKRKNVSERSEAIHFHNFWALVTCYTEIPATNHDQSTFSSRKMKFEPCWIFCYLLTCGAFWQPIPLAFTNCAEEKKALTGDSKHLCIVTKDVRTAWFKCQLIRTLAR